jgi:carboxyl-terminal processing protease
MDRTAVRVLVSVILVLGLLTCSSGGFLVGVWAEKARAAGEPIVPGPTVKGGSGKVGEVVDEAQGILDSQALDPTGEQTMTAGAVQGLLDSLEDSYAVYFDPKGIERFRDDQKGEFFGIGISIQLNDKSQPFVVKPFADTPAWRAGLKAGDVITAIDGVSKPKWDIDDVVGRIRGPKGTKVALRIERAKAKPFTVRVERDLIVVPQLMSKMIGRDVGYIRLMGFNQGADAQVRAKIAALGKQGAKGYILDLRENPGGLLDQAVAVSSLFITDGVIVRVDERGKPEEELRATGETATDKPLVLLIDENSASASEIVAAALKDHGRAVLVGATTYGKGSVQTVRNLTNGGAIKFTIAHYLSPKGTAINRKGVSPSVEVTMAPEAQLKDSTDIQLKRAVEVLRSKL